jgi:hypothetical protein
MSHPYFLPFALSLIIIYHFPSFHIISNYWWITVSIPHPFSLPFLFSPHRPLMSAIVSPLWPGAGWERKRKKKCVMPRDVFSTSPHLSNSNNNGAGSRERNTLLFPNGTNTGPFFFFFLALDEVMWAERREWQWKSKKRNEKKKLLEHAPALFDCPSGS